MKEKQNLHLMLPSLSLFQDKYLRHKYSRFFA